MFGYCEGQTAVGYPAWAGIDLRAQAQADASPRLPRVGGDRPVAPREYRECVVGYPAWAGIDLIREVRTNMAKRLPRVGGDRPFDLLEPDPNKVVTPRGRG